MSDSWRRATAPPFGAHSPDIAPSAYVAPAHIDRSGSRHHLDAALEFENARLRTKIDQINRSVVDRDAHTEASRRETMSSLQRERSIAAMADGDAKRLAREVHELQGTNSELRQRVAEREAKNSIDLNRCENAIAAAKVADANVTLRQQHEIEKLMRDIDGYHRQVQVLEHTVEDLRTELRSAGVTIATQNESIRGLTTQMSRLDPYHLIKQHREQNDVTSTATQELQRDLIDRLENLSKQLTVVTSERDAALNDLRTVQKRKEEAAKIDENAVKEQQARLDQAVSAMNSKLANSESEKAQLKAQLSTREQELERTRGSTSSLEQLKAENSRYKAHVQKIEAENLQLRAGAKDSELALKEELKESRNSYETKVLGLRNDIKSISADLYNQETEVKAMRKKLDAAEKRAQDAEAQQVQQRSLVQSQQQQIARAADAQRQPVEQRQRGFDPSQASVAAREAVAAQAGSPPVEVTLTVVNGRGLLDREGGALLHGVSDPFVVAYDPQGNELLRTGTVDDTLDPNFDPKGSSARVMLSTSTRGSITFKVWDWNKLSHKFMGQVVIPVADLFAVGPGDRVEQLKPRDPEEDKDVYTNSHRLGTLTINVAGVPKPPPGTARTTRDVLAAPGLPVDVEIVVERCESLLDRDGGGRYGKSDPYVMVEDPRKKTVLETKPIDNNLNPEYDPQFSTAKLTLVRGTPGEITLSVWDKNIGKDEFMGQVIVPLDHIFKYGPGRRILKLEQRPKESDAIVRDAANNLGTVTIFVRGVPVVDAKSLPPLPSYVYDPSTVTAKEKVVSHKINVRLAVVSGKGLLAREKSGVSDAMVTITDPIGKEILTTPVVSSCDPSWADFGEKAVVMQQISATVPGEYTFDVYDYNRVFKNRFLGCCTISVKDIFEKGDGPRVLKLQPRGVEKDDEVFKNAHNLGALTVNVTGVNTSGATSTVVGAGPTKEEVAALHVKVTDAELPIAPECDVTIRIIGCNDLMDRDGGRIANKGVSDPFVTVTDPAQKKVLTTPTIDDSLNPKFESGTAFTTMKMNQNTRGEVRIDVWDYDIPTNDYLGGVSIPVKDLFAYGPGERILRLAPRPNETDKELITRDADGDGLGTCTIVVGGVPIPSTKPNKLPPYAIDPNAPLPASQSDRSTAVPPTTVTVKILSCEGLMDREKSGVLGKMFSKATDVSDPYVLIKAGPAGVKELLKTPVIDDNLNPKWNPESTKVSFPIRRTASNGLRLEVWDHNSASTDEFLGHLVLTPQQMFETLGTGKHTARLSARENEPDKIVHDNAHALGTITFILEGLPVLENPTQLTVARAPSLGGDAAATVVDESKLPEPAKQFTVSFYIAGCHRLLDRDNGKSDVSDPLVKVYDTRGKEVLKTPQVMDNLDPTWSPADATATMPLSAVTPGSVRFEVWDWNRVLSHSFLGCLSLTVAEVFAFGNGVQRLQLQQRPKESESVILKNSTQLGFISIHISGLPVQEKLKPAATPAPQLAAPATSQVPPPLPGPKPQSIQNQPAFANAASTAPQSGPQLTPTTTTTATQRPADANPQPNPQSTTVAGSPAARTQESTKPVSDSIPQPKAEQKLPEPPKPKVPKQVTLQLYVSGCKDLIDRDKGSKWTTGVSDPYVRFLDVDGKELKKSTRVDNDLNPKWNMDQASVKIVAAYDGVRVQSQVVTVQLWDHNTSTDEFLGQFTIPLADVFAANPKFMGEHTVELEPRPDEKDKVILAAIGKLGTATFLLNANVDYAS
jgi:hypothetical protein